MKKEVTRLKLAITKGVQQRGIPVATFLDHAALGGIVDIDNAKAFGVALAPLKIVHQRPDKVAAQGCTLFNGLSASRNIRAQIGDALGIADRVTTIRARKRRKRGNVREMASKRSFSLCLPWLAVFLPPAAIVY